MNRVCISCVAGLIAVAGAAAVSLSVPAASAVSPAPEAAQASAAAFTVDSGHSSVIFKAKHNQVANFYGRFDDVSGSFALADGGTFDISIKADSVHSGNSKRDDHLKSPDFFSAKEFPAMTFKSKSVKAKGTDAFEVMGDLTFRGVTKPLTVTVKSTGMADAKGKKLAGMETTFTIKRSDFGSTYGVPAISDDVELTVSLEGAGG